MRESRCVHQTPPRPRGRRRRRGGEFLKTQRGIEQVRRDQTDDGTANNDALELTAPAQAAADDLDDVADGDAEFDFIEPGAIKK